MRSPMRFPLPVVAILAAALPCASFAQTTGFSFQEHPGESLDVLRDGKIIARYMDAHDTSTPARQLETYKPYLHVFNPEGTAPITKGAGGAFTHHRGIFIGWNKIGIGGQTYDRWHMKGGDQVHEKFLAQTADKDRASFTSLVRWQGATPDKAIIEDERTFTFLPAPAPAYALIDVVSKVKALAGETVLEGDPEHSGLHFRPADEVDRTKTAYLYPRENADAHKDRDYPWFGESYTLDGKRYSVVYLNHPSNPKDGRISAYRDYGRFGAFWTAKLPADGTQEIRARFLVVAGELPSVDVIQKAWNEYTGKNEPTPKTTAKAAEMDKSPDSKKLAAVAAAKAAEAAKPAAPEPAKPTTEADASKPAVAVLSNDPAIAAAQSVKRAGGGPETPELHFRPPPPPVHTPQEELKTFKVAPGFKVQLVASEPMIEAPIALSWDDQGRMYVLEMRDYMHDVDGAGEDQPTGRVSRLEDTNGDGVMDKATVFADNLLMPRAVMALGDGAIIGEPPNLVWYRDTDGDGVADKKEPISDKYATKGGQPEHMANSPTWMIDNWISSSGYPIRFRFQQGKFITSEIVPSGQWGRTQDDWGREYSNTNSDLLRADLVSPSYYLRNPRLAERTALNFQVMKDQTCWPAGPTPGVNRGYLEDSKKPDGTLVKGTLRPDGSLQSVTATCGAAIYRGDLFPKEYRGNAFIPEPSGNLVKRLILSEADGVVTAKNAYEGKEFLTSTDERFRPVNAYTGPDGALYIVDMAHGVLQHKGFLTYYLVANIKDRKLEQPYNLGRIFRIVPDGAKKPAAVKLPKDSEKIVPLLAHANGWVRDTAQRVLVERGDAVGPDVEKIAAKGATPQARVQALWTLEGLNALTPEVVTAALHDPHEKVRAAAVRLADKSLTPEVLKLVNDKSTEVRLHAAFKLSAEQTPEVEKALITLLGKGGTPLFGEAVASGMAGRELEFLDALFKHPAAEDQKLAASNIFASLAGCVMKERRGPRVAKLLELVAAQPPDGARQTAMLNAMAGKGAKTSKNPPPSNPIKLDVQPAALDALQKATPKAKTLLAKIEQQLTWPGKPGAVEAVVVPLTAEQQVLFDKGKAIYTTICGACHQPTGSGMPGLAPPLANSEWVLGSPDRIIRIVTQGLTGPIEVGGTKWQLEMPGLPIFSDEQVAGIATYIRREWEHNAPPVTPAYVTSVRAAIKARTKPWTADELKKPVEVKTASAK